jgi:glycosyltransferase involved in cell wall biosynthesis
MKVGILFEGSPMNPGGFNQSLMSALILNEIIEFRDNFTFITLDESSNHLLLEKNLNAIIYKNNFFSKILSRLYSIDYLKRLFNKLNIKHSFTKFLKKNNFEIIIFLSPHQLSLYCSDVNFVINIWDIDHKKSSYPEHHIDNTFEKRENFLNYVLFKSFKIIVAHEQIKNDLVKLYKCNPDKILVQSFISYLPYIANKKIKQNNSKLSSYQIPFHKKILFYPATFWPHKNHKYIIDAAIILKKKSINNFHFLFCGSDRGNFDFIKNEIEKNELNKLFTIIPFISHEEIIFFYENVFGVVMPTIGGPLIYLFMNLFSLKSQFFIQKIF